MGFTIQQCIHLPAALCHLWSIYTERRFANSNSELDLVLSSHPRTPTASDLATPLAAAQECIKETEARHARDGTERHSAFAPHPGDLILLNPHALRSSHERMQLRKLAARCAGCPYIHYQLNTLAYSVRPPPKSGNHRNSTELSSQKCAKGIARRNTWTRLRSRHTPGNWQRPHKLRILNGVARRPTA